MGKIVMDALTYGSFHQEVVLRLSFLKHHVASKSFYDKALYYANNINLSPEDRILDVLTNIQAEIIADFGKPLPGTTPTIYYSNLIWEFVYILLFYSHFEEPLWKETILPRMWKMQKNAVIRDEMKKGEEFVDEYISARRDFNEKKRAASLEAETVPDVVQIMRDINAGKIRYVEIDWEQQIKVVLKLCKLMPTKFPYVIWLWGLLGEIDDPTIRMDIIGKMQSAAPKCFDDQFEAQRFIEECNCIYQICIRARAYNLRNDIGIRHKWTDDRKSLNDLAHIFSDKVVEPTMMVALAEEMYSSVQDGEKKHYMLTLVLRAPRSIGKLTIDNIVDFAKNLYIAEGFRQLLLEGKEDSLDVPTLETFDWKLRNACFDVYIDLRKALIKEELEQDNTRVDGASDVECLEYLLEEESSVVDRENGLEQFRGSAAYNAMWYPGRQIVLDMINVFIKYLQTRIDKAKKEETEKEALAAISSNAAMAKMAAIVKQAMTGQVVQPDERTAHIPELEQPQEETDQSPQEQVSEGQLAVQDFVERLNTLAQKLYEAWNGKTVSPGAHQPNVVIKINKAGVEEYLSNMYNNNFKELQEWCYPPTSNSNQKFVKFVAVLRNKGFFDKLPKKLIAKKLAPIAGLSIGTATNYLSFRD